MLSKQNEQNWELSIDIVDDGGEYDCWALFGTGCWIHMAVGGERNREEYAFFQKDLVIDEELELTLLTLLCMQSFHIGYQHCRDNGVHIYYSNNVGSWLTKVHNLSDSVLQSSVSILKRNACCGRLIPIIPQ